MITEQDQKWDIISHSILQELELRPTLEEGARGILRYGLAGIHEFDRLLKQGKVKLTEGHLQLVTH